MLESTGVRKKVEVDTGPKTTIIVGWGIFKKWGNERVVRLPYKEKANAEIILQKLNEHQKDSHYLIQVKDPVTILPGKISMVLTSTRKIAGVSEDKTTGEQRMWRKKFLDIEVTTVYENRFTHVDTFTAHQHRGVLRVVGFDDSKSFEDYVKSRWPDQYNLIFIRLEE